MTVLRRLVVVGALGAVLPAFGLVGCAAPAGPARTSPVAVAKGDTRTAPSEAASCGDTFGGQASFRLDRSVLRSNGVSPRLLARLDASVHRYFRLLAVEFASRVCLEFRDLRWRLPVVAIHGDAHLEQYVVTPTTFGLEDYDRAGYGPAVVDLVRFASSIHLACREVQWPCNPDLAVSAFFRAYRESLDKPPHPVLPRLVDRVRKRTPTTPAAWLAWTDSLSQPLPTPVERMARQHWADFVKLQGEASPERPSEFFDIVRAGGLQMGIGSALEKKFLFRVRGPTDSPTDDVVIEARSTSASATNGCVSRPRHGASLQTLMFMSLLGPRMPQVLGTAALDDAPSAPEYWLQAWEPGYYEIAITDLTSQADLEELGVEAARQLAGHFWKHFPEPLRPTQRFAQLRAFDLAEGRASALAKSFAEETVRGWDAFRAQP